MSSRSAFFAKADEIIQELNIELLSASPTFRAPSSLLSHGIPNSLSQECGSEIDEHESSAPLELDHDAFVYPTPIPATPINPIYSSTSEPKPAHFRPALITPSLMPFRPYDHAIIAHMLQKDDQDDEIRPSFLYGTQPAAHAAPLPQPSFSSSSSSSASSLPFPMHEEKASSSFESFHDLQEFVSPDEAFVDDDYYGQQEDSEEGAENEQELQAKTAPREHDNAVQDEEQKVDEEEAPLLSLPPVHVDEPVQNHMFAPAPMSSSMDGITLTMMLNDSAGEEAEEHARRALFKKPYVLTKFRDPKKLRDVVQMQLTEPPSVLVVLMHLEEPKTVVTAKGEEKKLAKLLVSDDTLEYFSIAIWENQVDEWYDHLLVGDILYITSIGIRTWKEKKSASAGWNTTLLLCKGPNSGYNQSICRLGMLQRYQSICIHYPHYMDKVMLLLPVIEEWAHARHPYLWNDGMHASRRRTRPVPPPSFPPALAASPSSVFASASSPSVPVAKPLSASSISDMLHQYRLRFMEKMQMQDVTEEQHHQSETLWTVEARICSIQFDGMHDRSLPSIDDIIHIACNGCLALALPDENGVCICHVCRGKGDGAFGSFAWQFRPFSVTLEDDNDDETKYSARVSAPQIARQFFLGLDPAQLAASVTASGVSQTSQSGADNNWRLFQSILQSLTCPTNAPFAFTLFPHTGHSNRSIGEDHSPLSLADLDAQLSRIELDVVRFEIPL